jgi:hypothetical protein
MPWPCCRQAAASLVVVYTYRYLVRLQHGYLLSSTCRVEAARCYHYWQRANVLSFIFLQPFPCRHRLVFCAWVPSHT